MCVVSMVTDHYRKYPNDWWDMTKWDDYLDLKRKAEEYDRITKQPDCEDPQKQRFEQEVLKRLKDLEKKLANK